MDEVRIRRTVTMTADPRILQMPPKANGGAKTPLPHGRGSDGHQSRDREGSGYSVEESQIKDETARRIKESGRNFVGTGIPWRVLPGTARADTIGRRK